jgi:flagellar hook-length control protein FliK
MTTVNLKAALDLPMPEAPICRAAKLEPNQCFDDHLQRAASSGPAQGCSPPPSTSRQSGEDGQPTNGRGESDPVSQGINDGSSATQTDKTDQDGDVPAVEANEQAPVNEAGSEEDADEEGDEEVENVTEVVAIAIEAPKKLVDDVAISEDAAADADRAKLADEVAAADRKPRNPKLSHLASSKEAAEHAQALSQAAGEQAAAAEQAAAEAASSEQEKSTKSAAKKKPATDVKPIQANEPEKPADQSTAEQEQVTSNPTVAVADAEQKPDDKESNRKSRSGRNAANGENKTAATASSQADQPASSSSGTSTTVAVEQAANAAGLEKAEKSSESRSTLAPQSVGAERAVEAAGANGRNASTADSAVQAAQRLVTGAHSHKAHAGGEGSNLSEVDRVRFMQRVARAVQTAGERGGSMKLRLSPPELGQLRLEVSIKDGKMTARLEAENASARSVLLENLPDLKQRLAEQQIKVERFDVELMGQNTSDLPQQSESRPQQQAEQRGPAFRARGRALASDAIGRSTPPIPQRLQTNDQLNVVI